MQFSADRSHDSIPLRLVSTPSLASNRAGENNHDAPLRLVTQSEQINHRAPLTRILIVDDDESIRELLACVLIRHKYLVTAAASAEEALETLCSSSFDMLISDMKMSGMNGLELTGLVARSHPNLPIILITGCCDAALMRSAMRQGASDFIPKPFNLDSIPIVVERNLERLALNEKRLNQDREAAVLSNVHLLAATIDAKEPFTAQHSRRVARIAMAIAERLGLSESERQLTDWAAQVHDVGKIGTPDSILLKPGCLTEEEWQIVRQHPIKGEEIVGRVEYLKNVAAVVRWHHERVDGGGYPDGLMGGAIPLAARIIAVADAFEVMTSERVYQPRLDWEEAIHRLEAGSGTQFDTDVVNAIISLPAEILL